MAYYNYKRVTFREDYNLAKKEIEARDDIEVEGTVDYDGDAWVVVEYLLDKLQGKIKELENEVTEYSEAQPPI